MTEAFDLNWLLVLEERQRTPDGAGGFTETWISLGQIWAHVQARGVTAKEVTAGSTSRVRYKVVVRGVAGSSEQRPKIGQRFRNGNQAYAIDSVSEYDARGIYLICWAREELLS